MNLNELRDKAYKTACEYGFHDTELSNEHWLCLVISELMEAVEADWKGKRAKISKFKMDYKRYPALVDEDKRFICVFEKHIKDSVEDELADAAIRLLDLFGARAVCLNEDVFDQLTIIEYAVTYERKSFTESIFHITQFICSHCGTIGHSAVTPEIMLLEIFGLAKHLNTDLLWHIEQKMKYNQSREKMHGKKY